jgi:hypothetical protein
LNSVETPDGAQFATVALFVPNVLEASLKLDAYPEATATTAMTAAIPAIQRTILIMAPLRT